MLLLLLSRLSRVRLCAAHRAPVPGILQRRTPGWVAIASSGRGARKTKPAEFHPPSRPALWSRLHRTPGTPQPAGTTGQNLASRVPRPRRHTVERGGVLTVGEWPEGGKGGLADHTRETREGPGKECQHLSRHNFFLYRLSSPFFFL